MSLTETFFALLVVFTLFEQERTFPVHGASNPLSHTPHDFERHLLQFDAPSSLIDPAGP